MHALIKWVKMSMLEVQGLSIQRLGCLTPRIITSAKIHIQHYLEESYQWIVRVNQIKSWHMELLMEPKEY